MTEVPEECFMLFCPSFCQIHLKKESKYLINRGQLYCAKGLNRCFPTWGYFLLLKKYMFFLVKPSGFERSPDVPQK